MNTLRDAAQQALEALEQDNPSGRTATIAALRDALAQLKGGGNLPPPLQGSTVAETATTQQPVEQTPPSEYRRGYWDGFAIGKREGRIEAEDALAQPVQEPVAWMVYTRDGGSVYVTDNPTDIIDGQRALPLYTTRPPLPALLQRKPLTEEEIEHLSRAHWLRQTAIELVRKTEIAHGIVETPSEAQQFGMNLWSGIE